MIKTYNVIWEIDVDARSPMEAAKEALKVQRDPGSTATFFEVREHGGGEPKSIDLESVDVYLGKPKGKSIFKKGGKK